MTEDGWGGELEEILKRISRVAIGSGPIRVLRGGHRIALGLPDHAGAAKAVLDLYRPHRLKGRVFRAMGQGLLSTGLYRRLLATYAGEEPKPEVEWLDAAAAEGKVGFMGCNPSHGVRCILGGVCNGPEEKPFVAKLGFDRSRDAIVQEAKVLERLAGHWPGVVAALSFESGDDWALLRLPHLGAEEPSDMSDPDVLGLLSGWLRKDKVRIGENHWASDLLAKAIEAGIDPEWCAKISEREVGTALVHGDFAVWNLRLSAEGPCAIDWEWSVEEGVGGVDLAIGLKQEALLVKRLNPQQAVQFMLRQAASPLIERYLESCGWSGAYDDWLRFSMLPSFVRSPSSVSDVLAVLGLDSSSPPSQS